MRLIPEWDFSWTVGLGLDIDAIMGLWLDFDDTDATIGL